MNSTRENKRRRVRKEVKKKSLIHTEISENSNTTIFEQIRQQVPYDKHSVNIEDDDVSVSNECYAEKATPPEKRKCTENESSVHGRIDEVINMKDKTEISEEFVESCSNYLESDCVNIWMDETSCLSVNGPPIVQSSGITQTTSSVDIEEDEVTSLPTMRILSEQLRTSLKLISHSTIAEDNIECESVYSLTDDGKDAFADEEWEIPKEYVPAPYNVELDFEE